MKLLSAAQIREADAYTIAHEPVASIDLMERASRAFVDDFIQLYGRNFHVNVFCGAGNNGGDGLAIARMLLKAGYVVDSWIMASDSYSADCSENLSRLSALCQVNRIEKEADIPAIPAHQVIIDALFGSGLSRPVTGIFASLIEAMNASGSNVVAVDAPSGLMSDSVSTGTIVKANYTISFEVPKLAFLLPGNSEYVGKWYLAKIGLHQDYLEDVKTNKYLVEQADVQDLIIPRSTFAHKGSFGRALLVAGSHGKMGACILAARACLRSGIGLLTAHIPKGAYSVMQTAIPELMVLTDKDEKVISQTPKSGLYDVLGLGPGIGTDIKTVKALGGIFSSTKSPMVIDADALNILSENRELFSFVPEGSILTPHLKELERLIGSVSDDFDRLEKTLELAGEYGIYVVIKGAHSVIATPEGDLYFNTTGNPGMATAGSGDVLTGVITGILGSGYTPKMAATLAVYVHGMAGDLAVQELGQTSLTASDIVNYLPKAFQHLE